MPITPVLPRIARRRLFQLAAPWAAALALGATGPWAVAATETPDAWVGRLSREVLDDIRADKAMQAGDMDRLMALVDGKIMPNVNFRRMTASAVGPGWRQASAEQRQQLEKEFKTLLVRTYAGALSQVKEQRIEVRPLPAGAMQDNELTVRTLIHSGGGEPVQLDYRLEKTPGQGAGWKIYDLNVLGVWLVATYRPQFSQQINSHGVDGLIQSLSERNTRNAARP